MLPNLDDAGGPPSSTNPDSIFNAASNATSDDQSQVRRTITMVRTCVMFVCCVLLLVNDDNAGF